MYCKKTPSFSGEIFKENFTDIFYTNLEQIAFSLAFPIKNSVKRKVEKKPKAKISLHIKIGDYLSSGDKIGEKESNICKHHYSSVASYLPSPYKRFQVQIKDIGKPVPKNLTRVLIEGQQLLAKSKFARRFDRLATGPQLQSPSCPLNLRGHIGLGRTYKCARAPQRGQEGGKKWDRNQIKASIAWLCTKGTKDLIGVDCNSKTRSGSWLRQCKPKSKSINRKFFVMQSFALQGQRGYKKRLVKGTPLKLIRKKTNLLAYKSSCPSFCHPFAPFRGHSHACKASFSYKSKCKALLYNPICKKRSTCTKNCKPMQEDLDGMFKGQKINRTPLMLTSSGRVVMISKNQLVLQKTQPVLFYDSAKLHVKKGEFVLQGAPLLTLTHQTLITGDIVQGIPRIEQLFEAFTSPQKGLKDKKRLNVHDTLHSQVRDIFRKNWLKNVLSVAVRKSLEEIGSILLELIQKVYLSQGVLISDKHIEIIIRQMTSKGQILDSGSTGLLLEEVLPIRQIENANITTPGKKCLYVPSVVGLTAAALTCDSFISAASFQETTRVLSRDAVVGKTDFLRGLKEKVVIGDLISAGTGLDIYFVYTLFSESINLVPQSKTINK